MIGMTDARALAELVVADTALVGTLARLPEHVQGVIRAYGGLCARKAINTYAARLRGEAQAEQPKGDFVRIDRHQLENIAAAAALLEGTGDVLNKREGEALRKIVSGAQPAALSSTAAPQPVAASPKIDPDWNMREILSRAAPAPVVGDAVAVDDEMVERACAEWWGSDWGTWTGYQADSKRAKARRILTAALRTGGGA